MSSGNPPYSANLRNDYSHIDLACVIPLFFNQKSRDSLYALLRRYASYSPALLRRIMFILVDDHSPDPIAIPDDINLFLRLYRIDDDITWNQAGARNLGASMAPARRLLLTDVDHIFPEELLIKITDSPVPRHYYKFKRVNSDGTKRSSPCNIMFLSKGLFMDAMCYDEEFCGHYGYEDVFFRDWLHRHGYRQSYLTRRLKVIAADSDRDDAYHDLRRDTTRNLKLYTHKKAILDGRHPDMAHSRLFLNFRHHLVEERSFRETVTS